MHGPLDVKRIWDISRSHSNLTWLSSVLPNYSTGHDRFSTRLFQFVIL